VSARSQSSVCVAVTPGGNRGPPLWFTALLLRVLEAPAIAFFDQLPNTKGWSIQQNNFTVGVRGSLSTHTELKEVPGSPKLRSFAQELVDLGVPQGATKRICKQVVLKTLEVHGAMIRSYYAAKFNPTTVDFSSSFKDAHLIHKILQKP